MGSLIFFGGLVALVAGLVAYLRFVELPNHDSFIDRDPR